MKQLFVLWVLFAALPGNAATRYVAPDKRGDASGLTADHAADFLDAGFWAGIQSLLQKEAVTVKFAGGDYRRAYTEKAWILAEMGNKKNRLVLEGEAGQTVFTVPVGYQQQSVLMVIRNTQNLVMRNFSFTGNGKLGYALQITSEKEGTTRNIRIENCSWTDMRGIIYGATGAHQPGTSAITYKGCRFKRVGIDSHSHFMYHAHHASGVEVTDCYFEDATGDYVRFRDHCDYGRVTNSTFVRTGIFPAYPFISVPLFNDVDPGDETFATHYIFTGNRFTNTKYAIAFHHYGFDPAGKHYLLTAAEGAVLMNGQRAEKKKLLLQQFGIRTDAIKIRNNINEQITGRVMMGSFPRYGAVSRGWSGWGDISMFFK